jgi:hypothetical protein
MRISGKIIAAAIVAILLIAGALYFFRPGEQLPARPAAIDHVPLRSAPLPSAETQPAAPTSTRTILVENGTLTLELHDQPLGPVLADISKKSHVGINSSPAIDGRLVTIEMRSTALEQGLQELLRNHDVFIYRSGGALRSVWVYEREAGAQLVPVPPESWASTADVERQMHNGSPAERISAIETLVGRNGPNSADAVNRALLDDNDEVRLRGLDVALSAGVTVSRETLTSLTYDSSAFVRALALEAIASGTPLGDAREAETDQLLRRMMGDPDAEVRGKAAEILDSRSAGN